MVAIRLAPELFDEVRSLSPSVTQAVEQGLGLWLARERRKLAKVSFPARLQSQPSPPGGAA
jgi:hypothetical protein